MNANATSWSVHYDTVTSTEPHLAGCPVPVGGDCDCECVGCGEPLVEYRRTVWTMDALTHREVPWHEDCYSRAPDEDDDEWTNRAVMGWESELEKLRKALQS